MSVSVANGVSATLAQFAEYRGTTAPTTGNIGDLWQDISTGTPVLNQCTSVSPLTWTPVSTGGGGGGGMNDPGANGVVVRTALNTTTARTLTAGTGISISNGSGVAGNPTITNSAPDQTVVLTAGTNVSITGTYPNFTINATGGGGSGVTSVNGTGTVGNLNLSGTVTSTGDLTLSGSLSIGTLGFTPAGELTHFQSSVNNYNQVIVQNTNSGAVASTSVVVTNNLGTDSTFYGEFGMNSSGFTGTGSFNAANAVYLAAASGDLVLGTITNNAIKFVVNNGTTDAMTLNASGTLLLGSNTVFHSGNLVAGSGITITGAAGTWTIDNTGAGSGGVSLGLIVASAIGMNLV